MSDAPSKNPASALPPPHHAQRLTEQRNENSMAIDRASISEALAIINAEDALCSAAATQCQGEVEQAIERVVSSFRRGGRLIYVGAGTSGRLGVLDASEQPPTFGVPESMVRGVIAGGPRALMHAMEGVEDHPEDGAAEMVKLQVRELDTVCGIASGGRTPFVLGALAEARERQAATILLTCTPPLAGEEHLADIQIHALVGPEVITGSTRLKAGTVTKLILNQITTVSMIQIGKVYENLMVDLKPTNNKLIDRSTRILADLAHIDNAAARKVLKEADLELKVALVMAIGGLDAPAARTQLAESHGHVATAIRRAKGE